MRNRDVAFHICHLIPGIKFKILSSYNLQYREQDIFPLRLAELQQKDHDNSPTTSNPLRTYL